MPLNSKYALKLDVIVNIVDNNKVSQIYSKVIKNHFMSKEIPNDELLFPNKSVGANAQIEAKNILDYERATETARSGGVGILAVPRDLNKQVLEVVFAVCDENGDLIEVRYNKGLEINSHSFMSIVDMERAISWNKGMISREIKAEMKRLAAGIFAKEKK